MELGGCCLTRYGSIAAVLPSKADQIMSRFRPIAPKPMALSYPPLPDADRSVSSAASVDARPVLDVSRSSCNRRVRKRRTDFAASPSRASKRAAGSVRQDSSRDRSSASNGGCGVDRKGSSARSGTDAFSVGGIYGVRGGLRSCVSMETTASSEASVYMGASAASAGVVSSGLLESTRMMEQDLGFMERAAASAPASVLPERKGRCAGGGDFTEMIRGITGLPSAADVHSLLHHSRPSAQTMPSSSTSPSGVSRGGITVTAAPPFCEQIHGESRIFEQPHDGCRAELITLSLLPEVPSRADTLSSNSCISICDLQSQPSVDMDRNDGNGVITSSSSSSIICGAHSLSLFGDEGGHTTDQSKDSVCDLAYFDRMYGNSSEPVLLLDDAHNILWVNRAYERAFKDSAERQAGKHSSVVPFIDPLGVPTQSGRFNVQLQGRGCSRATLWGFLKKLVVDAGSDGTFPPARLGFSASKPTLADQTDACLPTGDAYAKWQRRSVGIADCASGRKSGVIVPQPIRLVGSTVSLESVTEIDREATPVSGSLEGVKKQLEEGSYPAFITDSRNLVRWVNVAYKQMVGQPECPWLASAVSDSKAGSSPTSPLPTPLLTGEVLLIPNVDTPKWAPAFSGRVNIQWTNAGERSCMTVPCDVSRLDDCCSGKSMLIWKFDIDASLRLTCGV